MTDLALLVTKTTEDILASYAAHGVRLVDANHLVPSGLVNVWQMSRLDQRAVLLFRKDRLTATLQATAWDAPPAGTTVELVQPGEPDGDDPPFIRVPVSAQMPGWDLALRLIEDPFAAAARRQNVAYMCTAALGIAGIAAMSLFVGHYVTHRVRLTRLKNDLIATVSHELKTPLASM